MATILYNVEIYGRDVMLLCFVQASFGIAYELACPLSARM